MVSVEVYDSERRAQTLVAIKYVRQLRGLGLAAATRLIDEVYYDRHPITLAFGSRSEACAFAEHMSTLGFSCRLMAETER